MVSVLAVSLVVVAVVDVWRSWCGGGGVVAVLDV